MDLIIKQSSFFFLIGLKWFDNTKKSNKRKKIFWLFNVQINLCSNRKVDFDRFSRETEAKHAHPEVVAGTF